MPWPPAQVTDISIFGDLEEVAKLLLPRGSRVVSASALQVGRADGKDGLVGYRKDRLERSACVAGPLPRRRHPRKVVPATSTVAASGQ